MVKDKWRKLSETRYEWNKRQLIIHKIKGRFKMKGSLAQAVGKAKLKARTVIIEKKIVFLSRRKRLAKKARVSPTIPTYPTNSW